MAFVIFIFLGQFFFSYGVQGTYFTFRNNCNQTIWPGILPGAGQPLLQNGGFELDPGQAVTLSAPDGWSGRFWGRTGCVFDQQGRGSCTTGDCGGLHCSGVGGKPPATLAEFTISRTADYYDVSLVDGYNLMVSVVPGRRTCEVVGCRSDVNQRCPKGLQVLEEDEKGGSVVVAACKSACTAFGSPRYCCTGAYGGPATCKPTAYSRLFKESCPTAYSYAFDDSSSLKTCKSDLYVIAFG